MIPRMAPEIAAMVAEYTAGTPDPRSPSVARHPSQVDGDSPAEWMRAHFNWPRELTEDQMEYIGELGNGDQEWRRPGSANHHSLTLHPSGAATVWSDNCPAWMHRYSWPQRGGAQTINAFTYYAGKYHGGDLAAASAHIRREFMPPPPRMLKMPNDAPEADDGFENDSWFKPVDLTAVLDGTETLQPPSILVRADGVGLFYPGAINGIHGESGLGKGWVAMVAVAEQIKAGNKVIYIDLEDTAVSIVGRLRTIGCTKDQVRDHLIYLRPVDETSPDILVHLVVLCVTSKATLVILDSLGEAFGLDSINEDKDAEVGPWLRRVPRALADTGACVVVIDHATKSQDNPLYPSGSKRKRAAVGGAAYQVEALKPLVKGQGGKLRLTTAKDRHGFHRRANVAAEIVFTPSGPTDMLVKVFAPHQDAEDRSEQERQDEHVAQVAVLMLRYCRSKRTSFTKTAVVEGCAGARKEIKRLAWDLLVERGQLEADGAGKFRVR